MTDLTERQPDLVRIETPWGEFPAVEADGVVRLRNIRYARADRFAAPQPVDPDPAESAELQFTTIACPQPPSASAAVLGDPLTGARFDEDCLRLTITRPAEIDGPLPVMVCFHGGAYVSNAGDLPGFDPSTLVREHGLIVVSVTYRLGLLGFIGDDARQRHSANLGLLDVIEALRWVRDRIAGFGGDPDAVTVSGHSSGGDAIAHVLVSEGADGLVRRAIIQSAPFGIRNRRDAMHAKMREAIGELRSDVSYDDLFAAQARAKRAGAGFGLRSGMSFCTEYGRAPLPAEADIDETWRRTRARPRGARDLDDRRDHVLPEPGASSAGALPHTRDRADRPPCGSGSVDERGVPARRPEVRQAARSLRRDGVRGRVRRAPRGEHHRLRARDGRATAVSQ